MVTVYHPTFPDVTVEVANKAAADEWADSGWRKSPLKAESSDS
jgi:hypothetical protein